MYICNICICIVECAYIYIYTYKYTQPPPQVLSTSDSDSSSKKSCQTPLVIPADSLSKRGGHGFPQVPQAGK